MTSKVNCEFVPGSYLRGGGRTGSDFPPQRVEILKLMLWLSYVFMVFKLFVQLCTQKEGLNGVDEIETIVNKKASTKCFIETKTRLQNSQSNTAHNNLPLSMAFNVNKEYKQNSRNRFFENVWPKMSNRENSENKGAEINTAINRIVPRQREPPSIAWL